MVLLQELPADWEKKLVNLGFMPSPIKSQYESYRMAGDGNVIVFKSGKVLFQGTPEQVDSLNQLLLGHQPKVIGNLSEVKDVLVGTDEALKGDTFGGILVAGVRADFKSRLKLIRMGARDSKLLSKEEIKSLANEIMKDFPWYAANILPEEYNRRVEDFGVTGLLNQLHAECFEKLKIKGAKHVVDRFPGCKVGDIALIHGESESVEVAAASIIARHLANKQIEQLSVKAGMVIPMGSTHVSAALEKLRKSGLQINLFVKMGFRNVSTKKFINAREN